jgi:hypothetical protein
MIKLQKMQYNVWGLLGSTALATGLQFIPIVGNYVSWAALLLCLWKVTRADIVPDIIFTVAIPGAIMFCLNLWGFAALMGELRPDLKYSDRDAAREEAVMDEDEEEAPKESKPAETKESKPSGPARALAAVHDLARKIAARAQTNSESAPTTTAAAGAPRSQMKALGSGTSKGIYLKGVSLNAQKSTAMISAQGKFFTVGQGEVVSIPSANGRISLRCDVIEKSGVSVTLNDSEQLILRAQ